MDNKTTEEITKPLKKLGFFQRTILLFFVMFPLMWYVYLQRMLNWTRKHNNVLVKINIGIVIFSLVFLCFLQIWLTKVRGY